MEVVTKMQCAQTRLVQELARVKLVTREVE